MSLELTPVPRACSLPGLSTSCGVLELLKLHESIDQQILLFRLTDFRPDSFAQVFSSTRCLCRAINVLFILLRPQRPI